MRRTTFLAAILCSALGTRLVYDWQLAPDRSPLPLRIPLRDLPRDLAGPGWEVEDVPLGARVEDRAGTTSYLNRVYRRGDDKFWIYIGYVSGWSPSSIHDPGLCLPGSGYVEETKEIREFRAPGLAAPARFHEYSWKRPALGGQKSYTLSTFCFNGGFEPSHLELRAARVWGIRYFAIVTVHGSYLGDIDATRAFYGGVVERLVPELLQHLPDTRPGGISRSGTPPNGKPGGPAN